MPAAIPFIGLSPTPVDLPLLGPVSFDPWTILVVAGCLVGLRLSLQHGRRVGVDLRVLADASLVTVALGFLVAHLVVVVAYFPERLERDGLATVFYVWQGLSSFGGFLGAVIGSVAYLRWKRPGEYFRYADVITYGFPFGWLLGRVGCSLVHDHIGRVTTFPLAMDFDHGWFGGADPSPVDGIRHELGLYEAVLTLVICAAFLRAARAPRPDGYFLGLFSVIYAPARFFLDFLRNTDLPGADARYFGLTPAQYGCAAMLAVGVFLLVRGRRAMQHAPARPGGGAAHHSV